MYGHLVGDFAIVQDSCRHPLCVVLLPEASSLCLLCLAYLLQYAQTVPTKLLLTKLPGWQRTGGGFGPH